MQVRVIIDANAVLRDLISLARRKQPDSRTDLLEVLDAETIIAFAPPELETEVRSKFEEIAEQYKQANVSVERLEELWQDYQKRIRFHAADPGPLPANVPDPKDLPYLFLHYELGTDVVCTTDHHFPAMDAKTIGATVILNLRNYSRAAAIELTISFAGTVIVVGSTAIASLLVAGVKALAAAFGRLSPGARLAVATLVAIGLLHPRTQKLVRDSLGRFPNTVDRNFDLFFPLLQSLADAYITEHAQATRALQELPDHVRSPRRLTAKVHAFRICVEKRRPLRVDEIERQMLVEGYRTKAKNFNSYLRRLLREHPKMIELPTGEWMVRSEAVT